LFVVGLLPTVLVAQTPKFKVLVLDALDGKPQPGVVITSFCEGIGFSSFHEFKTASDGIADVIYYCDEGHEEIDVEVPGEAKGECGGLGALTLTDILTKGIISVPNGAGNYWCPTKQRRKLKPVPGQIIIFVKKPTWWQSHVAG
jgi:hypothetical protein